VTFDILGHNLWSTAWAHDEPAQLLRDARLFGDYDFRHRAARLTRSDPCAAVYGVCIGGAHGNVDDCRDRFAWRNLAGISELVFD
jgi:hypothetical protein